jgi:hypothetical protein
MSLKCRREGFITIISIALTGATIRKELWAEAKF